MSRSIRVFRAPVLAAGWPAPGVRLLHLGAPPGGLAAAPGQFVSLAVPSPGGADPLLRRPFSIHRLLPFARRGAGFAVLFKVLGEGTAALAALAAGAEADVLGPLGRGFDLGRPAPGPALLVGGGMGLAPLPFLAEELRARGKRPVALYGFTGSFATPLERPRPALSCPEVGSPAAPRLFAALGVPAAAACTERRPGTFPGTAVELLRAFLDARGAAGAEIFACGPRAMLAGVARLAGERGLGAQVLLEERMACGFGACQSCVCRVRRPDGEEANRRVCVDGPAFDAAEVVW